MTIQVEVPSSDDDDDDDGCNNRWVFYNKTLENSQKANTDRFNKNKRQNSSSDSSSSDEEEEESFVTLVGRSTYNASIEEGQQQTTNNNDTTLVIKEGKCINVLFAIFTLFSWAVFFVLLVWGGLSDGWGIEFLVPFGLIALFFSTMLVSVIRKKMILSFNDNNTSSGGGSERRDDDDVMIRYGIFSPTKTYTWDQIGSIILQKTYYNDRPQEVVHCHVRVKNNSPHNHKWWNLFSCRRNLFYCEIDLFFCEIDPHQANKLETLLQLYQPEKLHVKTTMTERPRDN